MKKEKKKSSLSLKNNCLIHEPCHTSNMGGITIILSIALTREHKGIHISIYYVSKALVDSRTMHSPLEKLIFILVIAI